MDNAVRLRIVAVLAVVCTTGLCSSALAQKVDVIESAGKTEVIEGGSGDSYAVVLETQPAADVTITLDVDGTQLDTDKTILTFTSANWANAQTVTVSAVDDSLDEGLHTSTITNTAASSDPDYNGTFVPNVVVSIVDNDAVKARVNIVETAGKTEVTEDGATDSYTVALETQPTADVTVTLGVDAAQLLTDKAVLTFTSANWANAQTVTVSAVDDALDEGLHGSTITNTAASTDPDYDGLYVPEVFVSIVDNDTVKPDVNVVETGGSTAVAEGGAIDSYLVALALEPTADVTVTLTVDNGQLQTDATTLTFTPANWNVSQSIQVSAVDDHLDEGLHLSTITHTASSSDIDYDGIYVPAVVVSITDNDKAGVTITESGANTEVAEGGTGDIYQVSLDTQPSSTVTITLTVPAAQILTDRTALDFTSANWSNAQTVAVSAVDDHADEGTHLAFITHVATSSDPLYAGVSVGAVTVFIVDNDATTSTRITSITKDGGAVMIGFDSASTNYYHAEISSNLLSGGWDVLTNNLPGTGTSMEVADPENVPVRFYRLLCRPSPWE